MPLSDADLLLADRLAPRLVMLWLALQPLRSVAGFAQSGAHPDDETSAMLAALRFRDGLSTAYICATRGEGGQNDIGAEKGADLAALRSAEMAVAAARLDMRLWWLAAGPGDPIADFGFSKSGTATLARWGRAHTLARFVAAVRAERPDILCPTFLDVPGQHGHHRAMTALAHEVIATAADPAFAGVALPPWQVARLVLPAWGGGGTAYDDEEPPPPASFAVAGTGRDAVTGWTWARMGEWSRAAHRTQGMGRWPGVGEGRDFPLHLAVNAAGGGAEGLLAGLPATLADLGLPAAARAAAEAVAAFPDAAAVLAAALAAHGALDGAEARVGPAHAHRVARKRAELARVIALAAGVEVRGRIAADRLSPGEIAPVTIEVAPGAAEAAAARLRLPPGWVEADGRAGPAAGAAPSEPFAPGVDPLAPLPPALTVGLRVAGREVALALPLDHAPRAGAAVRATPEPAALIVNLARPPVPLALRLSGLAPEGARPALALPAGWGQDWQGAEARLTPPAGLAPGRWEAAVTLSGAPALDERRLAAAHLPPVLRAAPAVVRLLALQVELPAVRLGYVGGGNDRVDAALAALGLSPQRLTDAGLAGAGALDGLDSLIVGVFAFRTRPALSPGGLRAFVEAGGTLVTLYHRPWDGWDAATTPPRRLEIGQPSIRFRVTDPAAPVRLPLPDHPLLVGPNPIGPDDWAGWDKERGLYFARAWDAAYRPLVAVADPGEAPLEGGLLVADIGAGRHVHVALNLHHQMEALVPGAFRLMANLIARR
ncbi:MAG: PIG-L family deacetylase [Rhodobacteraceae bacterium]|jgi:LmbE family N-acetylglucosaminyl deacetylase|nr:PIG-L family deacetylase [Paracoccaceae bacterium]